MVKNLLSIFLFVLASCSANKPNEYQIASLKPTPKSFEVGSRWAFVLLDYNSHILKSVVFEITDNIEEKTCESGTTKRLKVISEYPTNSYPKLFNPIYIVTGSAIRISFSPKICDGNYALIGSVSEVGASGRHEPEELSFGNKKNVGGKFYGFPLAK